uniref:Sushi domain-containing protein n=1 Tax=Pavo cristatus TaxID=9049 RepID=A0A8C9FR02_PAVCR
MWDHHSPILCYVLLNLIKSRHSNFSFYDLAITCGPPPPVLYGKVEGSDYRWGASVSYSCAEGYQLSNTAILSCEGRGIWRGDIPQCLRKFSGSIVLGFTKLSQTYSQFFSSQFKKHLSRSHTLFAICFPVSS